MGHMEPTCFVIYFHHCLRLKKHVDFIYLFFLICSKIVPV
jgi:hypothetical protein